MKVKANVAGIYQGFHRSVGDVFEFDAESASHAALESEALDHLEDVPADVEIPTRKQGKKLMTAAK